MTRSGRNQGFALMLAVFLIVTLAAIGVYLVTVSTGQSQAVSQDVQGVRAYQAARAGLEWGAYQRLIAGGACTGAPTAVALPAMNGYCAVVTCTQTTPVTGEIEGTATVHAYKVMATGCNVTPCSTTACSPATPGPAYVERQLQITLSQ
jgi:MSHA biogenesis protein MshP